MSIFSQEYWSQIDLEEIIANKLEESINVDFKSSGSFAFNDKTKADIAKDVSAFANSDGGIILYGINEKDHVADSLSYIDGSLFTKEWLEQVIASNIQRKIEGLQIYPVRFDGDMKKTIYVVKIPASSNAPHMARDKKYYKRYNFESVPMEEYEVRNIYLRRQNSKLEIGDLTLLFSPDKKESIYDGDDVTCTIQLSIKNTGSFPEDYYKISCSVNSEKYVTLSILDSSNLQLSNLSDKMVVSTDGMRAPIFPGEELAPIRFHLEISCDGLPLEGKFLIETKLFYAGEYDVVGFDVKDQINNYFNEFKEFKRNLQRYHLR